MAEEMKVYTREDVYNYAYYGNVDNLRLALGYGNNSTDWYRNENGFTALHAAAEKGYTACIYVLLNRGADIESKENQGRTALHVAAAQGNTRCIRALLDRGADIESKENNEFTALHAAASGGHNACIRVLLDRGADIESKQNQGYTSLHLAACQGNTACIGVLLDKGADIESKDNDGVTALLIAAHQGHIESTRLLLDRGADIESKDRNGVTALLAAAHQGHIESTRLLLDRQAIIDEASTENIPHPECKQMILDEIQYRLRRAAFDSFINHHIEYPRLINSIYSRCYPSGDLRVTSPAIGWDRAEAVRNKYYFDEVLFYVHVYVASVCTRSKTKRSASSVIAASQCREQLAISSDKTSTLMTVLSSYLKEYLIE